MKKIASLALMGLLFLTAATQAVAQKYIYVYKDGVIIHRQEESAIAAVVMEENKSVVTLYDADRNVIFRAPRTEVDSISPLTTVPQADLLDVQFLADGTAIDVSPRHMKVTKVGSTQFVSYSDTYKRYMATFANPWGGSATGYYKMDYESNTSYSNALADGHTLECVFAANFSGTTPPNSEAKPFSSHQGGGTGFLVSTTSGSRKNEITFLPHTTSPSNGWKWATSGIVPQKQTYYHVVGVWDKTAGKARIYVNGELKNTVDASGSLNFPSAGSKWFGIGCDPDGSNVGGTAWSGNVVLARIYNDPLSGAQVGKLWEQIKTLQEHAVPDMITNLSFLSGLPMKVGCSFYITAEGFQEGDRIEMASINGDFHATLPITLTAQGCSFLLPEGTVSGQYTISVKRGSRTQNLGVTDINIANKIPAGMRVIAHRGHWNVEGSAQNSRSSLQNAFAEQCYASETDVWITTDGHVMVNHDASFGGTTIETSSYAVCKRLKLSNGEYMPELKDFLELLAQEDSTKLIIEIKTHSSTSRGHACIDKVLSEVESYGVKDKVEYIAFSLDYCQYLAQKDPSAHIAYLNGDKDPATLHASGIMGLDYTAAQYRSHPTWIVEAHRLGMTTNVWTIDDVPTMIEMANMGIDFVTTNNPVAAKEIYAHYAANHTEEGENPAFCDEPIPNLLDLRFNADGTVEDLSAMKNKVTVISSDNRTVPVEYVPQYDTYAAHLNNTWGGTASTYCRVDYGGNMDFMAALGDGHTMETIFCADYSGSIPNKEAKWFTSHQAGGTGFLISTTSGSRKNEITFLPNVSTSGSSTWRWATSGVVPEPGKYYHVVGVWNKEEGKAYIYVNGELKNKVDALGSMVFPNNTCHWFGIGADPSNNTTGDSSGNWHIVRARIYDKPLTPEEVNALW